MPVAYAYGYSHRNIDANCYGHSHGNGYSHGNINANCCGYCNSYIYADSNSYGNVYAYTDSDTNRHGRLAVPGRKLRGG